MVFLFFPGTSIAPYFGSKLVSLFSSSLMALAKNLKNLEDGYSLNTSSAVFLQVRSSLDVRQLCFIFRRVI